MHRHNVTPLQQFKLPDQRFYSVYCDPVGKLPPTIDGFQYLFSIIDRYTRHLEVVPLKDTLAKTVADAFIFHRVARFGCPTEITCDRGSQFKPNVWEEMCNFLGCKLNLTCSYRPQCNGIIKRTHRTMKAALKAQEKPNDRLQSMPWVLLALRATPKSDHGVSSAQLTLGTTLRLPRQFFVPPDSEAPQNQTEYARNLESTLSCVHAPPPV